MQDSVEPPEFSPREVVSSDTNLRDSDALVVGPIRATMGPP